MSYSAKRSFSFLQNTKMRCPKEILEDDDGPIKKKMRKNLVEIFNRASMSMNGSEDHMNVFLRIKPFTNADPVDENQGCLAVDEQEQSVIASAPDNSHTHKNLKRGLGKSEHRFTFSRIFNEDTSQAEFFNETMLGMTKEFISGQNSLVFTYGVTSSGKTYTIQGKPQDAGILPRSLDVLFNSINGKQIKGIRFKPRRFTDVVQLGPEEESFEHRIKEKILKMSSDDDHTVTTLLGDESEALSSTMASCSSTSQDESLPDIESRVREELKVEVDDNGKFNFTVWVSFAEIYNEQIFDLLERIPQKKSCKRTTLKISDDQNGSPYIKGLNEIHVESADEAYRLLSIGKKNLQMATTRLNHCSSRSHCIFTIKVIRVVVKDDPNIARVSMLSFCDLAGSERYSKTQATGDRLKEAGNINTSLLTLGRCIEILRFNQVHRDSVKVVPFRDSKLTRLFTNFFNGSGRAAMIVNVSQCASMFDETLQVFKFSAIAKQVKYLQKPVEPPKPKRKKTAAPLPRPSIPWETEPSKLLLEDASNIPLPTDDSEEDISLDDSMDVESIMSTKTTDELIQTIKFLIDKNAKLAESLEEEMINASNTEMRVRREVCETMKKQQVLIEKEYSKMLEESEEDAREAMDKRIQKVIDCYEKKLERIQRKVDDDDEWVSSLLLFQEEKKVEERDQKIAKLEKALEEKEKAKILDDTGKDEKIEQLEERIADLKCLLHNSEKKKDEKIEELLAYVQEAGDVYKENMEQIARLRQEAANFALETKAKEDNLAKVEKDNIQLEESYKQKLSDAETVKEEALTSVKESESKVAELESMIKDVEAKLVSKDNTIKTLEEECEQMQGEIERLQDQMSQMGDVSKRSDPESSVGIEDKSELKTLDTSIQADLLDARRVEEMEKEIRELQEENETLMRDCNRMEEVCEEHFQEKLSLEEQLGEKENECVDWKEILRKEKESSIEHLEKVQSECNYLKETNKDLVQEKSSLIERLEVAENECKGLRETNEDLMQGKSSLTERLEVAENECKGLKETNEDLMQGKSSLAERLEVAENECKGLKETNEDLMQGKSSLTEHLEVAENECKGLRETNENLNQEILVLQEEAKRNLVKKEHCTPLSTSAHSTMITDIVKEMETKSTPCSRLKSSQDSMADSEDEIVFNHNLHPAVQSHEQSGNQSSNSSAVQLKDAEITINALRNKLRSEEEDFFQREQALIHGYTAEIDNLKSELVKLKKMSLEKSQVTKQDESIKNISVSSCHESMDVCSASNSDKCSKQVLLSEIALLQEQLISCKEAQRQLQCQDKEKMKSSSSQAVVEGSSAKRYSTQDVVCRNMSITDSVLQFEMTEYAVELDAWRNKVEDLNQKIGEKEKLLNEARCKVENLEKEMEANNGEKAALELKLESEASRVESCENELEELKEKNEALRLTVGERDVKLDEISNELKANISSHAEMKGEMDQLRNQIEKIEEEISSKNKIILGKDQAINESESRISDLRRTITLLEDSQSKLSEQFENKSKDNSCHLRDIQKELQDVLKVNSKLTVEKERLEKDAEAFEDKVKLLSGKIDKYESDNSSKDKQLLESKFQLDKEREAKAQMEEMLEKIKQDHQQESAEVSQKLILLEKEKRLAERKLNEVKGKEQEWQMKYQAQDKMKELEHQLQNQLKTTRESLKKHSSKNSELFSELAQQRTENCRLQEEIDRLKDVVTQLENNQSDSSKMAAEIESLKQDAKQAQKENKELMASLNDLKTGLLHSDEMTERQENIILAQDEDISILKSKLEELDSKNQILSKSLSKKEEEVTTLLEKQQSDTTCDELSKEIERLKEEISNLKGEISKSTEALTVKDKDVRAMTSQMDSLKETLKQCEKDLAKQQSINRRNKEEMEDWQKEKDKCLTNFEDVLEKAVKEKTGIAQENDKLKKENADLVKKATNSQSTKDKAIQENTDLTLENEKLKKDNADLVKQVTNSQCAKDKVIADLRKNNNTLSIELASMQGMSPPPKIETPDHGFPNRIEFTEDAEDTTGHLEVDATPPAALRKGKKRHGSKRHVLSAVPDDIFTPTRKSLKTIEETNEQSPHSSDSHRKPLPSIASDLANEVFASISPMTRSGKQSRHRPKNPPVTGLVGRNLQDENELPLSTRRSSRLRTRSSSKQ